MTAKLSADCREKQIHLALGVETVPKKDVALDIYTASVEGIRPFVDELASIAIEISTDCRAGQTHLALGLEAVTQENTALNVHPVAIDRPCVRSDKKQFSDFGML